MEGVDDDQYGRSEVAQDDWPIRRKLPVTTTRGGDGDGEVATNLVTLLGVS